METDDQVFIDTDKQEQEEKPAAEQDDTEAVAQSEQVENGVQTGKAESDDQRQNGLKECGEMGEDDSEKHSDKEVDDSKESLHVDEKPTDRDDSEGYLDKSDEEIEIRRDKEVIEKDKKEEIDSDDLDISTEDKKELLRLIHSESDADSHQSESQVDKTQDNGAKSDSCDITRDKQTIQHGKEDTRQANESEEEAEAEAEAESEPGAEVKPEHEDESELDHKIMAGSESYMRELSLPGQHQQLPVPMYEAPKHKVSIHTCYLYLITFYLFNVKP